MVTAEEGDNFPQHTMASLITGSKLAVGLLTCKLKGILSFLALIKWEKFYICTLDEIFKKHNKNSSNMIPPT